jgi:hypothetical protein
MERAMTLREIAGLMRRHLLAATVVLMLVAGTGYCIKSTSPMYSEGATVVFTVTDAMANAHLSGQLISPLIATEVMMTQVLMSPAAQDQVRAAGGTAQFELAPVNFYSMQYPDYAEPSATLTTASQRPADVQRTFRVVLRLLGQRLAAIQAQAGVPPRHRIRTFLIGDTGPIVQPGSPMRVFAGLAVLAVVALFTVTGFLDRRRRRRRTA